MEIQYYNRSKSQMETEKVYGDKAVRWLYDSSMGKAMAEVLVRPSFSKLYGAIQGSGFTKKKVSPFIKNFDIQMDDFLPTEGRSLDDPYGSFNEFFIRRLKPGARQIIGDQDKMPAFAEARYFGHSSIDDSVTIPVKGAYLKAQDMIGETQWTKDFEGGPFLVARLCPVDYHRFHFPDDGEVLNFRPVHGVLHSVNPIALKKKEDIFITNERHVTIMQTKNFGKLAYIEVGAICVGRIVQTSELKTFKRGEEKGYFLFGGSTVVVLGEKGAWRPSQDILEKTQEGIEVYLQLGQEVALKA